MDGRYEVPVTPAQFRGLPVQSAYSGRVFNYQIPARRLPNDPYRMAGVIPVSPWGSPFGGYGPFADASAAALPSGAPDPGPGTTGLRKLAGLAVAAFGLYQVLDGDVDVVSLAALAAGAGILGFDFGLGQTSPLSSADGTPDGTMGKIFGTAPDPSGSPPIKSGPALFGGLAAMALGGYLAIEGEDLGLALAAAGAAASGFALGNTSLLGAIAKNAIAQAKAAAGA